MIALALLAGIVLAGAGVATVPVVLKARIEAAAAHAIGRPVSIADLRLRPAWPPTLVASDLRAAGLGSMQHAIAQFDPGSLLGPTPAVAMLTLVRPVWQMRWSAAGRPVPQAQAPSAPRASTPGAVLPTPAGSPRTVGWRIEKASVEDGQIVVVDPRTGHPATASLSATLDLVHPDLRLQLAMPPHDGAAAASLAVHAANGGPIHYDAAFVLHGRPIRIVADGGTFDQFGERRPVDISVAATAPGATLTVVGTVTAPTYDVRVELRADDASKVVGLFGPSLADAGAVTAEAHAVGNLGHVALSDMQVSAPQIRLGGAAELTFGQHPRLHGTVQVQRLDLDAVLAALAAPPPVSKQSTAVAPPAPRASAWLIPDRPLPFPALARGDADFRLAVGMLHFGGVDYRDLTGHVALHAGRLDVAPFAASLPGGAHLQATLHADAAAAPAAVALTLHAPAVALAPLLAAWHRPDTLSGMAAVDATLRGRGDTLHALASSLDGTASVRVTDGAIDSQVFADLLGAAHLPARLPPGQTPVRCAAVGAVAQGGTLQLAPLVADTDRVRIEGVGSADLAHETLALQLTPLLRGGPGLIIPMRVTGPWRAPKMAIGLGGDVPVQTACPAAAGAVPRGKKPPKPIDLLRSLLR